jgi:hypothetical protein
MKIGEKYKGINYGYCIITDIKDSMVYYTFYDEPNGTKLSTSIRESEFHEGYNKQPMIEEPQTDKIVESVINQFKQRSEIGIAKYGKTLERKDLSTLEWIEHAKQEAMDFILYLERLKQEII